MGAEQVSDPRNSTRLPKAFKKQDVSNSQLADGVFCTACPTEGEADWTIVYKDEHEEEFLQSDDDIVKKVMNEASTLLNVVTTGKAPTEDSACRNRVSARTDPSFALLSWFVMYRQRKEGGQAWSDHRLHPERVSHKQKARHLRRCTQAQRFHPEHDHWRVAGRQQCHLNACTQDSSPPSCRVHTKRGSC